MYKSLVFGDGRGFERETPNVQCLLLRLSSICRPNFITFPQAVLWAVTDQQKTLQCLAPNINNNRKKTNRYNRCLRTFGAWLLNIGDFFVNCSFKWNK